MRIETFKTPVWVSQTFTILSVPPVTNIDPLLLNEIALISALEAYTSDTQMKSHRYREMLSVRVR